MTSTVPPLICKTGCSRKFVPLTDQFSPWMAITLVPAVSLAFAAPRLIVAAYWVVGSAVVFAELGL